MGVNMNSRMYRLWSGDESLCVANGPPGSLIPMPNPPIGNPAGIRRCGDGEGSNDGIFKRVRGSLGGRTLGFFT